MSWIYVIPYLCTQHTSSSDIAVCRVQVPACLSLKHHHTRSLCNHCNKVKQAHSRVKAIQVMFQTCTHTVLAHFPNVFMLLSITFALIQWHVSKCYKLYKALLHNFKSRQSTACLTTPQMSPASREDNTQVIQNLTLLIILVPCCISAWLWRFAPVVSNVLSSLINGAEPLHCSPS